MTLPVVFLVAMKDSKGGKSTLPMVTGVSIHDDGEGMEEQCLLWWTGNSPATTGRDWGKKLSPTT